MSSRLLAARRARVAGALLLLALVACGGRDAGPVDADGGAESPGPVGDPAAALDGIFDPLTLIALAVGAEADAMVLAGRLKGGSARVARCTLEALCWVVGDVPGLTSAGVATDPAEDTTVLAGLSCDRSELDHCLEGHRLRLFRVTDDAVEQVAEVPADELSTLSAEMPVHSVRVNGGVAVVAVSALGSTELVWIDVGTGERQGINTVSGTLYGVSWNRDGDLVVVTNEDGSPPRPGGQGAVPPGQQSPPSTSSGFPGRETVVRVLGSGGEVLREERSPDDGSRFLPFERGLQRIAPDGTVTDVLSGEEITSFAVEEESDNRIDFRSVTCNGSPGHGVVADRSYSSEDNASVLRLQWLDDGRARSSSKEVVGGAHADACTLDGGTIAVVERDEEVGLEKPEGERLELWMVA